MHERSNVCYLRIMQEGRKIENDQLDVLVDCVMKETRKEGRKGRKGRREGKEKAAPNRGRPFLSVINTRSVTLQPFSRRADPPGSEPKAPTRRKH